MRWCADNKVWRVAVACLGVAVAGYCGQDSETEHQRAPTEWADLVEAYDTGKGESGSPVENLTLPIEHYDSGRVRAVLRAVRAVRAEDGFVRASQVQIELFTEIGKREGLITAESCLFNFEERRGYCRGNVTLVRQEVEVSGNDLYWSLVQQRVVMLSAARVVVKEWTREMGERL